MFQRLFNVIRVNLQNVQIVTKEMSPTSKPQTWNTVVSRPLQQNETEPPRRYDCSIARLYWEVTLHSNKTRRSATLFHHFDIVNSFWSVKLYSIFDQHLDLVVSIATRLSLHSISLFRVENTSFRIVAWGIRCHSSPRKRRRSAIVLCSVILFWTALPRTSHTCSIQLRSGDIAGHSKRPTLLACRNPSTILAWCGLALSSWKMPLLPIGRRKGNTWGRKISSM